jgi:hypothetical protein
VVLVGTLVAVGGEEALLLFGQVAATDADLEARRQRVALCVPSILSEPNGDVAEHANEKSQRAPLKSSMKRARRAESSASCSRHDASAAAAQQVRVLRSQGGWGGVRSTADVQRPFLLRCHLSFHTTEEAKL